VVNFLYPRLGKENRPRLRLEWLPSGNISNQSLDLSSHHFNLHSFISPTSNPYSLNLVTLYSHIHHLVSEPSCHLTKFAAQTHCPNKNTKETKPTKTVQAQSVRAEIWHGVPMRLGTTVPPPFSAFSKLEHKHGPLVP